MSAADRLRLALQNAKATFDSIAVEETASGRRNSAVAAAARAQSREIAFVLQETDPVLARCDRERRT